MIDDVAVGAVVRVVRDVIAQDRHDCHLLQADSGIGEAIEIFVETTVPRAAGRMRREWSVTWRLLADNSLVCLLPPLVFALGACYRSELPLAETLWHMGQVVVLFVIYTLLGWQFGVLEWVLLWQAVVLFLNLVSKPGHYLWCKTPCMIVGTMAELAAAWQIVRPLDTTAVLWIAVISPSSLWRWVQGRSASGSPC
ncbi:hypothetical protein [Streptomyces sp. NPDC054866]